MPLFSSSTPFDGEVEKATSELNTTEDWALILDICDKIQRSPSGAKDCLKSIVKRMNHRVPHVAMQSLTLLDACVNNCGRPFHLEVASRDFVSECRTLIGKAHPKVVQKLKQLIKKWAEEEFKSDPALDMVQSLYSSLLKEGHSFSLDNQTSSQPTSLPKDPNVVSSQQEESDIAKAIALSLEEEKSKKSTSLYPSFSSNNTSSVTNDVSVKPKELIKVKALYDFEAAEDNELTFKAGEIIGIVDDSDVNWWKGKSWRGEGLFPANFVTTDLSVEVEDENKAIKEKKSVQFNEEIEVKEVEFAPEDVEINEEKIDECLSLLQNADPTGETTMDPAEMNVLEEQCKAMGPLIDAELEKIDKKHIELSEVNRKVLESLEMYNNLMRDLPGYGYSNIPNNIQQSFTSLPPVPPQTNGHMIGQVPISLPQQHPTQSFSPPPPPQPVADVNSMLYQ